MSKSLRRMAVFVLVLSAIFLTRRIIFPKSAEEMSLSVGLRQTVPQTVKPIQPGMINRTVRVIYPNGGETLVRGKTYVVRWESTAMQNVKLELVGPPSVYTIGSASAAARSWNWTVPHQQWGQLQVIDLEPGAYVIKISDPSGQPADSSDASFQVVLPQVDLECRKAGATGMASLSRTFKIQIRNNGTRILNDVLFNWVIKKNGVLASQDGAGYGQVYPNTIYECEIRVERQSHDESWRIYSIDFYLDPQNRQGEEQGYRGNNQLSFNGMSLY